MSGWKTENTNSIQQNTVQILGLKSILIKWTFTEGLFITHYMEFKSLNQLMKDLRIKVMYSPI